MMSDNPFDKLIDYLDAHQLKKKIPDKVQSAKKNEDIIKDLKIHSYFPGKSFENPLPKKSNGFDVSKFESLMRETLIQEYKSLQNYERPYISVSELYTCLRQCYYSRMKYQIDLQKLYSFSYLYLIQKVGNTVHETIQKIYNFSEIEKKVISEKFKTKGRVDAIKDNFIFEIKTIDIEKFKNEYIREHYLQGIIYAYILNTEYDYKIDTITIIYVMRNLKKIIPFDLPIDNILAKSMLDKALLLKDSLNSLQVPDPFGATEETCKFCLYNKYCEKDNYEKSIQPSKEKIKLEEFKTNDKKTNKSAFLL